MDSNLAIQRPLSQGKNKERSPMELKEQFELVKEMASRLTVKDREGGTMEWKEQVQRMKEMMPCFTEEMICQMLEQCYIDSDLTLPRHLSPEADSKGISQSDDVSSPPAAAVSSVASQLHGPNMGNRKGKEVVRSVDDNNAVISRSHDPPLHAVDPLRLRASSAGSDPWASRNNAATVFAHQASAGSSSTPNGNGNEFSGEKSIWGEWKVFLTPDREKLEIPQAVYDAFNNPNPGSSGTWERKLSPTSSEPVSSGSTLHDQYQYRNDSRPLTIPGPTATPDGIFPLRTLPPANANNGCGGEGSSPQYDNQGGLRWQCPGTRVRPSHRLQSPYNRTTGNLQDPSSIQPTQDPGR